MKWHKLPKLFSEFNKLFLSRCVLPSYNSTLRTLCYHILYKTALLTYKTQRSATPPYLADLLQSQAPARPLRSAGAALLSVPRSRTVLQLLLRLLLHATTTATTTTDKIWVVQYFWSVLYTVRNRTQIFCHRVVFTGCV